MGRHRGGQAARAVVKEDALSYVSDERAASLRGAGACLARFEVGGHGGGGGARLSVSREELRRRVREAPRKFRSCLVVACCIDN